MRPVLFEWPGEPLRYGHRSHSSVAVRHGSDGPNVDDVTEQEGNVESIGYPLHFVTLGEQDALAGGGYVALIGVPDPLRARLQRRSH